MKLIDKHAPAWIDALFIAGPLSRPLSQGTNSFALMDCAFAPKCFGMIKRRVDAESWRSLYQDTTGAIDEVIAHSPVLLNVNAMDKPILAELLHETDGLPMLTFLHSVESFDALAHRLSMWCVIDADGQHFVLRFPDTRRLPDILNALSPEQQRTLCGPGMTWHFRGRDATWQAFTAPSTQESHADQLMARPRLDGSQCATLIAASEPDELAANVLHLKPGYGESQLPSSLYQIARQAVIVADWMELETTSDRMGLCELFWQRPELAHTQRNELASLRTLLE